MIDPKTTPKICVSDLAALMNMTNVKILDCSWYLPQEVRDPLIEYELGHIPGGLLFDWEACSGDNSTETCLYLPPPERFTAYVSELGIGDDDLVVVYDNEGFHTIAARAWWMFRVFGHDNVVALDGGLKAWQRSGMAMETDMPAAPQPIQRGAAGFNAGIVRTFEDVLANVGSRAEQVVDVRSYERYLGTGASHDKRPGHIPGAISLPFVDCLDKDTNSFRPIEELKERGENSGVDIDKPIIAYCGGGGSSPVVALGYYLLGNRNVAIYDGAWDDWCIHEDSPIEQGDGPSSA